MRSAVPETMLWNPSRSFVANKRDSIISTGVTSTRKFVAEGLGVALLLAAVVGSGIVGERLSAGNVAIALLANTVATGATLVAIILALGDVSGAHLNPAVSMAAAIEGDIQWREVPGYVFAQVLGALAGVASAHAMFG